MASPVRYYAPGSIHLLTRRTTQRKFLLRPDPQFVQGAFYLLGYEQERHGLEIHDAIFMSNHPHILATDVRGDSIPRFNQEFNSLLGRFTNCLRGRDENVWSSGKPNTVEIAPRSEDVVDKWSYLRVNAVEAGLVSHAKKWPGLHVPALHLGSWQITTSRPNRFFDPDGDMPLESTLTITTPRVWDATPEELRLLVAQECNRREEEIRERFKSQGRVFMGAKAVKRQSPVSSPKTPSPRGNRVPHVACKDSELRKRYLRWRKERAAQYEAFRQAVLEGDTSVVFPVGTWALHFHYGFEREPWGGCMWRALASEP